MRHDTTTTNVSGRSAPWDRRRSGPSHLGRLHSTVASTVASTVVLQMVPYGVAKGGGAIRQRLNEAGPASAECSRR